jgi:hypothetical protein
MAILLMEYIEGYRGEEDSVATFVLLRDLGWLVEFVDDERKDGNDLEEKDCWSVQGQRE